MLFPIVHQSMTNLALPPHISVLLVQLHVSLQTGWPFELGRTFGAIKCSLVTVRNQVVFKFLLRDKGLFAFRTFEWLLLQVELAIVRQEIVAPIECLSTRFTFQMGSIMSQHVPFQFGVLLVADGTFRQFRC